MLEDRRDRQGADRAGGARLLLGEALRGAQQEAAVLGENLDELGALGGQGVLRALGVHRAVPSSAGDRASGRSVTTHARHPSGQILSAARVLSIGGTSGTSDGLFRS